ncbi:MAG: hypothetical protein ACOX6L_06215 [Syntrophomonadaceae bacterium]|mgnify:CR=1 FL=1|jgi:hypothetical protein
MTQRLVTEQSNQLHQLLVTVSRYLYFASDGQVRYQEKPMEVNTGNLSKSHRDHLVYYMCCVYSYNCFFDITSPKKCSPPAYATQQTAVKLASKFNRNRISENN